MAGVRILVADDDASTREVLTVLLEDEGYEVRLAADGREVLEQVWQGLPSRSAAASS